MRRVKFWAIGIISFFSIAAGTILHRVLAVSLCTVLGFNSTACFLGDSSKVNAAVPPVMGNGSAIVAQNVDIFRNDGGSSQQPQTDIFNNPNPRRPQFDRSNLNLQPSIVTVEPNKRYQINGTSPNKNSQYTAEIMVDNGQTFVNSIDLTVKGSNNLIDEIYNIQISRAGTEMNIESNSRGTLTIKRVQNSWISQFTNPSGISTRWEIPIRQKINKNFIKMINKRLCEDQVEEVISRNIPNLLDFINEIADRFKRLFALGLQLDRNLENKPEQKEKLFEEFEEKIDELKDFNDKLKESIECEPSETTANQQPTRQTSPVVTSFGCNGGITCTVRWGSSPTLRFTYEDKNGNASSWEMVGFTRGEPVAKGTISPPDGTGTINYSPKCDGSGSRDFPVSVTVTDTTGLKSAPLSVTIMCR